VPCRRRAGDTGEKEEAPWARTVARTAPSRHAAQQGGRASQVGHRRQWRHDRQPHSAPDWDGVQLLPPGQLRKDEVEGARDGRLWSARCGAVPAGCGRAESRSRRTRLQPTGFSQAASCCASSGGWRPTGPGAAASGAAAATPGAEDRRWLDTVLSGAGQGASDALSSAGPMSTDAGSRVRSEKLKSVSQGWPAPFDSRCGRRARWAIPALCSLVTSAPQPWENLVADHLAGAGRARCLPPCSMASNAVPVSRLITRSTRGTRRQRFGQRPTRGLVLNQTGSAQDRAACRDVAEPATGRR